MKRRGVLFVVLLFMAILLCGCNTLPESGPYGTIDTATAAAEYNDVLYFLYNVGPVFDPVNIAAYDLNSEEFYEAISIPEQAIMGFQIYDDVAYCLTAKAVYACSLDGKEQRVLAQTDEEGIYRNAWFFRLEDALYICRSTFGAEKAEEGTVRTQILALSIKNGAYTIVAERDNMTFWYPSAVAYWDGKLYARTPEGECIYILSLEDGSLETLDIIHKQVMALQDGVYAQVGGVDGSIVKLGEPEPIGQAPDGWLIGCSKNVMYYLENQYGTMSAIYRMDQEGCKTLTPSYQCDMVTDIKAYVVEDLVLFYTSEDLTGDAETDNSLHYIYLIHGDEIKKIGSYIADYPYT